MRCPNVTYTPLALNAPTAGFPWDNLRKILHEGQMMDKVQNDEKRLPKVSTSCVERMNITDEDNRRICDSKDPNVT